MTPSPPPAPREDLPALRPSAQSARIQRACERLAAASPPIKATRPRPLVGPQDAPSPVRLDLHRGSVERTLRRAPDAPPRPLERPSEVEDQLERATPQFFLRNTARLQRAAEPDDLARVWRPLRDGDWAQDLGLARACGVRPPPPPPLASALLAMHVAERRALVVEARWSALYGRPDPQG